MRNRDMRFRGNCPRNPFQRDRIPLEAQFLSKSMHDAKNNNCTKENVNVMTKQEMVDRLPASKFVDIGRCASMEWLIFDDGEELSLHLQCSWRLIVNDQLRLVSDDIFEQPEGQEYDENFDWDVQGDNRFDHLASDLKRELPLAVRSVHLSSENDLVIEFDKGSLLYVFAGRPLDAEAWRFFVHHGESSHLVAVGRLLEEQ